jgi:SpoVK/Ycf46/Vps4 family AAA+-type ATPase
MFIFISLPLCAYISSLLKEIYSEYFGIEKKVIVGRRVAEMAELQKTTFDVVGGLDDVKAEIREALVLPLLHPDLAKGYGVSLPKGVLLFGPPGCGKTLLMKALATELGIEMISINCSDIMSKWYGESESRVAELFRTARMRKPCILFLDEIDAIGKRRDMYAVDEVTPRVLSMILSELDGLESASGIVVVGSTNKPELVDPALLRPGRIDKVIYVPPPDKRERAEIFQVHLKGSL